MDNSYLYSDGMDRTRGSRLEEISSYNHLTGSGYNIMPAVKQENQQNFAYNTLELASPELEKMFIGTSSPDAITTFPTPDMDVTTEEDVLNGVTSRNPAELTELRNVNVTDANTDKKQQFSKGFDAALQRLYRERGHPYANDRESSCSPAAESPRKYENVPSASNMTPLYDQQVPCYVTDDQVGISSDSATQSTRTRSSFHQGEQERLKLAHRRARNREAAIRCRNKKLRRIGDMENRVKELRRQNSDLTTTITSHKTEIIRLKKIILDHSQQGCGVMSVLMQ